MAVNCININDPKYKELLEKSGLHPVVLKARISVWQDENSVEDFPTLEQVLNPGEVNFTLKSIDILNSDKAKQIFDKGEKNNWSLDKILTELQIPKEQKQLALELNINNREQLALELASKYSYTVTITTATSEEPYHIYNEFEEYESNDSLGEKPPKKYSVYRDDHTSPVKYFDTIEEAEDWIKNNTTPINNTGHYSNLTVPGGINYSENEIATPLIKPSIKGHAAFSTNNGIGWFRSDEQRSDNYSGEKVYDGVGGFVQLGQIGSKTRRILELQSDLFQKSRNNEELIDIPLHPREFELDNKSYTDSMNEYLLILNDNEGNQYIEEDAQKLINKWRTSELGRKYYKNNFLQLLNKNSNWVTFFIKSIIQDSIKKGYEKVLFPSGDTASKIEGHTTLEQFIQQKRDRIKHLQNNRFGWKFKEDLGNQSYNNKTQRSTIEEVEEDLKNYPEDIRETMEIIEFEVEDEINQLTQEIQRVETEGFGALKPIYNFYENQVQNILKKQGYSPQIITDEFGNKWNEITLDITRDKSPIFLKKIDFSRLENSTNEIMLEVSNQELIDEKPVDFYLENTSILFNNQQGKFSVNDVLNNILANYNDLSQSAKFLVEKASKLNNLSGSNIRFVDRSTFDGDDVLMEYNADTNTINISRDVLKVYSPEDVVQAFIHEVAHSTSIQSYLKPSTFEEKDFRDLIDKMYNKYKDLSIKHNQDNELSYGFTNQVEFIAELYSNSEFQKEIKDLEKGNKSLWSQFLDAVRRLFGLNKTNDYNKLIEEVINTVETNRSDFKGFQGTNNIMFQSRKERVSKPKLQTLEDKLTDTLNIAKDNLDQLLKRSKSYSKQNKEKGDAFQKHTQELIDSIAKVESLNEWKGITIYLNSLSKTVNQLNNKLINSDLSGQKGLELIELYRSYLSSYNLVNDVRKLINDTRANHVDAISKEEIDQIRDILNDITGPHLDLEEKFNSVIRDIVKEELTNKKYATEVITKWKRKLSKDYNPNNTTLSKTEWIGQQMNTTYLDQINKEVEEYVNELIDGIGTDIGIFDKQLFSSVNSNSRLIQFFEKIAVGIRNKIIDRIRTKDFELKNLFDKFIKDKGDKKPSELYKNLLEYDNYGKAYLKGEYSLKFREEYTKKFKDKDFALDKFGKDSKEFEIANTNLKKWLKDNTVKENDQFIPIKKWKNDLSKLSNIEKQVLKEFQNIIENTNKQTFGKNSLIKISNGARFYELPAITISNLERVLEGKGKGIITEKWKDLTEVRPDDIGYREKLLTGKGDPLNSVRVHYRGNLSPEEQSLDLFTLMRLEFGNGVNYQEKQSKQLLLEGIVDIAKNKDYELVEKGSGIPIINRFAQRRPSATFKGIESNTYKRLKNLLDQRIYDVFYEDAPKLAGKDVNKLINGINGWTASLGMTLNYFAAPTNILNGEFQLFLERMAGNYIDKNSLAKAHARYTKDLPFIMKDLGQPIKTSFVNQVNQMFDTFGAFTVDQQQFIKNTLTKSLANSHTGNFMNEGGEHMLQSVLTMAVLNSIKVMNSNNEYIDKTGKVVDKSKASSLLDMLEQDSNGLLKVNNNVKYTDVNLVNEFDEGGLENVTLLIKKKVFDTMGEYDKNYQNDLQRHWYGKLLLMFKRYLIPLGIARFRGITTSLKSSDDLLDRDLHYSDALQEYEEGIYTSTIRFIKNGLLPSLKRLNYSILSKNWNELSDYEKANIRKSVTELATTALLALVITPLLASAADDDDDEFLWFLAMTARRLESELSQYRDPRELYKVTTNPVASLNLINSMITFGEQVITPWNWDEEDSKGNLKIVKSGKKLIPILNKIDIESENLFNYMNRRGY